MTMTRLLEEQIDKLHQQMVKLQQEKVEAEFAYVSIINSPSWRMTAPLRSFMKTVRNARAWLRLQKNKIQVNRSAHADVLLTSNQANVLDTQVSEISRSVDDTIGTVFSRNE